MACTIGIRREDKNRWERRAPLTPAAVRGLRERGIRVAVQPSPLRVFTDREYLRAGAEIREDLADCHLVMGVKEMPREFFREGGVYLFFSHTTKGQPANMEMLAEILRKGATLLDYELITGDDGRRLVAFSRFAGLAGMLDGLWALGRRLAAEGIPTPLARARRAWEFPDLAAAKEATARLGREIAEGGLPGEIAPLVIGITGAGRVARGTREILDLLPVREVAPEDLAALAREPATAHRHHLYVTTFRREQMYRRRRDGGFDRAELDAHPERYESRLGEFLPHLAVLVNALYWEPRYPRLVTREMLAGLRAGGRPPRLRLIADITCDIRGSIEATVKPTDPDRPTYLYLPDRDGVLDDTWTGPGPLVLAVDNLPCELPREASEEFSGALAPFVPALARALGPGGLDLDRLPAPLRRAVIAHRGELAPRHAHLAALLPGGTGSRELPHAS